MNKQRWLICALAASSLVSTAIAQSSDSQRQAKRILDSCEVKGGLIVHIGCRDGELTATQKLKRSSMMEMFGELVESMYS